MKNHLFTTTASWQGGLEGKGALSAQGFESSFSAPKSLGGSGKGANPEELLLAAASACFLITLAAVLTRRKIAFTHLGIKSELELVADGGLQVKRVRHFATVKVAPQSNPTLRGDALEAVAAAEANCLVARAMSGQVAFEATAEIIGIE